MLDKIIDDTDEPDSVLFKFQLSLGQSHSHIALIMNSKCILYCILYCIAYCTAYCIIILIININMIMI